MRWNLTMARFLLYTSVVYNCFLFLLCSSEVASSEKSLIYGYETHGHHPMYCEFASAEMFRGEEGNKHMQPLCSYQNPDMVWREGGVSYYPVFGYSRGANGKLLYCDPPEGIKELGCTQWHYVYSVCNYTCDLDPVPTNNTIECKLVGPNDNISVSWTPQPLCLKKHEKSIETVQETHEKENSLTIIIIISVVAFVCIVCIGVFFCKKRRRNPCQCFEPEKGLSRSSSGDSDLKHDVQDKDNGGRVEMVYESPLGGGPMQRVGISDLPLNQMRDSPIPSIIEPSGDQIDNFAIEWKKNPLNVTDLDLPLERKENVCEVSVQLLRDQSLQFTNTLCNLTEYLSSQGEEDTMKGLVRQLLEKKGTTPRAVDVWQDSPQSYLGDSKPCMGFLAWMADHDTKIGVLVDYFQRLEVLDHLMKVHKGCEYCNQLVIRKKEVKKDKKDKKDTKAKKDKKVKTARTGL